MITLSIRWASRVKSVVVGDYIDFVQKMANRLLVGELRYGAPNRRKKYLSRALTELKAYQKTGNQEHLINAANYCLLEKIAPEHAQAHFNNLVGSATRHSSAATGATAAKCYSHP